MRTYESADRSKPGGIRRLAAGMGLSLLAVTGVSACTVSTGDTVHHHRATEIGNPLSPSEAYYIPLYDPTPNTALRFDSHGAAIIDISKTRIRTRESSTTSVYTRRLGPLSVKHSTVDVYTTELPPAQVVLQGSVVPSFEAKGCAPDGNTAARIDFDFKQRDYSVTDMELPIDCHSVEAETLTSFNILGVTYDVTH